MPAGGEDPRNHFLGKEVLPSSSQHLRAEVQGALVYLSVFASHEALSMDHMLPAGRLQCAVAWSPSGGPRWWPPQRGTSADDGTRGWGLRGAIQS